MEYFSTRDPQKKKIHASLAIVNGIAPDGGLYVPSEFPQIKNFEKTTYNELALQILKSYLTDFTEEELAEYIKKAYLTHNPVKLNGDYLELFHGKTLAFKDVALQLFPYLLTAALKKNNINKTAVILAATSGDTGSAVLSGIKNVEKTKAIVFYPEGGVSSVQRLQMTTQVGGNVHVYAIKGNFDDAQTGVKEIFSDSEFQAQFSEKYFFTSANSINLGRLLPQIIYYFYTYKTLLERNEITAGEKINFVVPTGNFGNILAGYYAYKMGLPIGKLICATNKNDVLDEYFKTGVYNLDRKFHLTMSPSMDILISSNLERLNYQNFDEDKPLFSSESATDEETLAMIKSVYDEKNYLLDPHTAVAKCVYEKYKNQSQDERKTIIISTASPYKFPEAVEAAVGEVLNEKPEQIANLENLPVRHTSVVTNLKDAILEVLA